MRPNVILCMRMHGYQPCLHERKSAAALLAGAGTQCVGCPLMQTNLSCKPPRWASCTPCNPLPSCAGRLIARQRSLSTRRTDTHACAHTFVHVDAGEGHSCLPASAGAPLLCSLVPCADLCLPAWAGAPLLCSFVPLRWLVPACLSRSPSIVLPCAPALTHAYLSRSLCAPLVGSFDVRALWRLRPVPDVEATSLHPQGMCGVSVRKDRRGMPHLLQHSKDSHP